MRRAASFAAALVLVLAATACQGGEPAVDASAEPEAGGPAWGATPDAGAVTRPGALPEDAPALAALVAEQVAAAGTLRSEVSITIPGQSREDTLTAEVITGEEPVARITIDQYTPEEGAEAEPPATELILAQDVVYALQDQAALELGERPWIRLSREELAAYEAELGPFVAIFDQIFAIAEEARMDASTENLVALVEAGELTEGPVADSSEGAAAQRYEGTAPMAVLGRNSADEAYDTLIEEGVDTVEWTLLLDERGLPLRFDVQVEVETGTRALSSAAYSGWAEPIDIALPPEDEISSLQTLVEDAGEGGG
ncbi:hypothetical protein [Allonocardiopsis opalescens]|uniref:Lipoprotein n=1 Tax=Allonocardiopsis opalescens TaxID=1144618 RepID=A0A2T0Q7Y2_9ACTN|nr:hypothetical protein [Allonocardiopsis opalescens]PRX99892.1 hypothetical protein CLV72_103499 [Allonocardiopsis opalescens]